MVSHLARSSYSTAAPRPTLTSYGRTYVQSRRDRPTAPTHHTRPSTPDYRPFVTRGWSNASQTSLVCRLVELFKQHRLSSPHLATVITHNRFGEDGHIDHRNVHRAVVAAYETAYICAPASANALPSQASTSMSNSTTPGTGTPTRTRIDVGRPELRWKTCGQPGKEGRTVQGLPRSGVTARRRMPVPKLKVLWPILDYGEMGNRLKPATLPRTTCNETSKRKRLVESYLRDKGVAPGSVPRNVCHETRELWSQAGGGAAAPAVRSVDSKWYLQY